MEYSLFWAIVTFLDFGSFVDILADNVRENLENQPKMYCTNCLP